MKKYIIIIIVVGALIVAFLNIPQEKKEYTQEIYTVQQGDTLYKIAVENCENEDIREYINKIKKLNNKKDCTIFPNEKIIILIEK